MTLNVAHQGFSQLCGAGSFFELARDGARQVVFRHGPPSLCSIYRKAMRFGQLPLLIENEETFSYQEVFGAAAFQAERLSREFGVTKGHRVALGTLRDKDWIAAFIAVTAIGATAVLLPNDSAPAMNYCVEVASCDFIMTSAHTEKSQNSVQEIAFEQAPSGFEGTQLFADVDGKWEACIAFTSGTSGKPKGVILSHQAITTGLMNMLLSGAYRRANVPEGKKGKPNTPSALVLAPFPHISGYCQLLLALMLGGRVVRTTERSAQAIVQAISLYKVTALVGPSNEDICAFIAALPKDEMLPRFASISTGGRMPSPFLLQLVHDRLPHVSVGAGYGLTETNGSVCADVDVANSRYPGGKLLPTVECRIEPRIDHLGWPSGTGNVWLRGSMLMTSYCAPAASLHDEGWFDTKDIGHLSEDRILRIFDRHDRFFLGGDAPIAFCTIEQAIQDYFGTQEVALVRGPNNRLELYANPSSVTVDHIRAFLDNYLPTISAQISDISIVKSLSRTSTGKTRSEAIATP